MAVVQHGCRKIEIDVVGDIKWISPDRIIYGPEDLTQEEFNLGDEFLASLAADGWINNNWFEQFFYFSSEYLDMSEVFFDYEAVIDNAKMVVLFNADSFWEG